MSVAPHQPSTPSRLIGETLRDEGCGAGTSELDFEVNLTEGLTPEGGERVAGPAPGLMIGRYRLVRRFDHGGMGYVFLAVDTELQREVAIKIIKSQRAKPDEIERFMAEARIAGRIRHPNIVAVHDYGEFQQRPYLVMDYIAGGSLADRIHEFRGDIGRSVTLVLRIAQAVSSLHEHKIVHRDLKPGNILLTEAGEPMVADFGLAKALDSGQQLTRTWQLVGTPGYMSPEQITGNHAGIKATADIWALGVLLYELCSGQRPFLGSNPEQIFARALHGKFTAPRALNPDISVELEKVIITCLARAPENRYATAHSLAHDLLQLAEGKTASFASGLRWRTRFDRLKQRWRLALVALLFGLAVLFGIWNFGRSPDEFDAVRPIVEQLKSGQNVNLIPHRGHPKWYRMTGDAVLLQRNRKYNFTLQTPTRAMVELIPGPLPGPIRMECEIELEMTEPNARVGLLAAISHYDRIEHDETFAIGFLLGAARTAQVALPAPDEPSTWFGPAFTFLCYFDGRGQASATDHYVEIGQLSTLAQKNSFHLAVEIDADSMRAQVDNLPSVALTHEQLVQQNISPTFQRRYLRWREGGIGLYLRNAKATFRDMRVSPLQPD